MLHEPREEVRQELRQTPVCLVGTSPAAVQMREFATRAAATDHTVLLSGETGVGKDLLAELIHGTGRPERPFVPVDCGGLSDTLTESELFGHTAGAFTDARERKHGLAEEADSGTIFLNEVGNMALSLQKRFLHFLDRGRFRPVGATKEVQVDVRVIAATNADLEAAMRQGTLRSDLYYRLHVVTFQVPPLRERRQDIPALVEHFLGQEPTFRRITGDALRVLVEYNWPGNVRQLKHAVARASFGCREDCDIGVEHVLPNVGNASLLPPGDDHKELPSFYEWQRGYFREALRRCGGSIDQVATMAGVTWRTVYYKIKQYQLQDLVVSKRRHRHPRSTD